MLLDLQLQVCVDNSNNLNVKDYEKNIEKTFKGTSAPLDNYRMEYVALLFRIWHNITTYVFLEYDALRRVSEK